MILGLAFQTAVDGLETPEKEQIRSGYFALIRKLWVLVAI